MRGVIKKIVDERGFGFIKRPPDPDLFFHKSALRRTSLDRLNEGDEVEFEVEESEKGLRAKTVTPVVCL